MRIVQCVIAGLLLGLLVPPLLFILYSGKLPASYTFDVQMGLVMGTLLSMAIFAMFGVIIGDQWESSEKERGNK